MFFSRALLFSISLHGILILALLLRTEQESNAPSAVFVDLPPLPTESVEVSSSSASSTPKGGAKRAEGGKKHPVLPTGWSWKSGPKVWQEHKKGSPGVGGSPEGRGERVLSYGNKMDLAKEGKFHPFAAKLYARINSYLAYPADFVEENISGHVTAHFLVDSKGRFAGKFLEIEGDQKLLNVYTMAMIVLALREPISGAFAIDGDLIPIAVRVDYRLLLPDEFATRDELRHFKNTLSFERIAFTEPTTIKEMRRFIAKYTPPIIPVPGGFFIDFVSLYRHLTEKDSDDPKWKRGIRMELDHQLMEQFLRKAG